MDNSQKKQQNDKKQQIAEQLLIKQFEWYQVQTKVRELMSDILVPFNKKQTEESVKLSEMKKQIYFMSKKIEDHDFLLQRENATKPKYLQLQDQKIQQLQSNIIQNKHQTDEKLRQMQSIIDTYEKKILQLNKLQNKLDQEISNRISLIQQHKNIVQTKIEQMLKKMDEHNDDINTMKGQTRNSLNKFEIKLLNLQSRTKELEDESNRKIKQLKKVFEDIKEITNKIIKIEIKESQLDKRIKIRQNDYKLSEKFMTVTEDLKLELRHFQNYLSIYHPLYTQLQMSQTLHAILKGKTKKMLCLYEQQKYAKIHLDILNMEITSLQERMSSYSERIRFLIYKNRKFISNLKIEKSLKIGQNVYQIRLLQDDLQDEDDRKIIVPAQPSTEKIQEIFEAKLETVINKIKTQLSSDNKSLKIWIEQLQEQSIFSSTKVDEKLKSFMNKLNQTEAQFQLYKQYVENQTKDIRSQIESTLTPINNLKLLLKDIINFGSVINHIIIQDQIDRQGIALYGLRSQPTQYQKIGSTIQLDPKCLACIPNNLGQTMQAFKTACLTYQASHIKIQDQLYSRQQILQLSTNILQKLKQKIQSTNVNANVNISNSRVQTLLTRQSKTRSGQKSRSLFSRQKITNKKNLKTFEPNEKSLQSMLPTFPRSRKSKSRNSAFNQRQNYNNFLY